MSFIFSKDPAALVTGETLQRHFALPSPPVLVAAKETKAKRFQVWDADGRGLCVRFERTRIVAWMMVPRPDSTVWNGQTFAQANGIPRLA